MIIGINTSAGGNLKKIFSYLDLVTIFVALHSRGASCSPIRHIDIECNKGQPIRLAFRVSAIPVFVINKFSCCSRQPVASKTASILHSLFS